MKNKKDKMKKDKMWLFGNEEMIKFVKIKKVIENEK